MQTQIWRVTVPLLLVLSLLVGASFLMPTPTFAQKQDTQQMSEGPRGGAVPGNTLGTTSDTQFWRSIRQGMQGTVALPDKKLGVLVQSEGENWRAIRNGPVSLYGSWLLLGTIALLALFMALRGRVQIDGGFAGRTVERFTTLDRVAHWTTAVSFLVLALTGLNVLYGKYVLLPILGPSIFSALTLAGKYAHNFLAFPFMAGLVLMFLLWIRYNIPKRHDLTWLRQAGGLFDSKVHPPSERFNAGQKVIFWLVVLCGLSLSLSGLALLFPYQFSFFAKTFAVANLLGADLPSSFLPVVEQQLNQVWHTVVALVLMAVILAHIYIGSIGMQGAFTAMGSGRVDVNWATEHHNLWVDRLRREGRVPDERHRQPAE